MNKTDDFKMTVTEGQGGASVFQSVGIKMDNKTENKVTAQKGDAKKTVTVAKRTRSRAAQKKVSVIPEIKSGKPVDVKSPEFYLNREINWIDFDRKVLEQAEDKSVPLLELLNFFYILFITNCIFYFIRKIDSLLNNFVFIAIFPIKQG